MIYSKMSNQGKQVLLSWLIIAVVFFVIGVITGSLCTKVEVMAIEPTEPTEPTEVVEPEPEMPEVIEPIVEIIEELEEPETEWVSLGEFRLTAYCACEKCCGKWALTRPLDENGNPIIYTASGAVAQQGVTVAADTNVLPFGTVIMIDGHEYTVQDRGGAIKENRIDVYFESHEEAWQFGVQYKEIFVKG